MRNGCSKWPGTVGLFWHCKHSEVWIGRWFNCGLLRRARGNLQRQELSVITYVMGDFETKDYSTDFGTAPRAISPTNYKTATRFRQVNSTLCRSNSNLPYVRLQKGTLGRPPPTFVSNTPTDAAPFDEPARQPLSSATAC